MPNFRNLHRDEGLGFRRGYMSYFSASRPGWVQGKDQEGSGAGFKGAITEPGPWWVAMGMQGETIPRYENHVRLSPDLKDEWGIPQLITSVDYDDNDDRMAADFIARGSRDAGGGAAVKEVRGAIIPGKIPDLDIHEMGGVRMGKDPATSLLNGWNQFHTCKNVFVTDGACMVSTGNQNPSLTFMALTARATNHAVEEMKKQNI